MAKQDDTTNEDASKLNRRVNESLCYRLRFDSLSLVALMMSKTPNPSAEQMDKLLIAVQKQLVDALFTDETIPPDSKTLVFHFHKQTIASRISNLRGERRRVDRCDFEKTLNPQ